MSFQLTPSDNSIAASSVSFSSLKNTFGPEISGPISLSAYFVNILGDIGQTTSVSSFRGKRLPDPVLTATYPINVRSTGYEPVDGSFALGTNFNFRKRFFQRLRVQDVTISFVSNRFDANMVSFISDLVTNSIVANTGPSTASTIHDSKSVPVNITVRKRNGIVKTVLSTTVDVNDTFQSMFVKFNLSLATQNQTFSATHHGYHHVLHHDHGHHSGGGNQNNQGNPGHRHYAHGGHHHRGHYRHPDSATGRNPHVPDHRATHHNRDHGHHGNRDHGHHKDGQHHGTHHNHPVVTRSCEHHNYGKHQNGHCTVTPGHHTNHANNHNHPAYHHGPYHHNHPAHHHNHAHHSSHHHTNHSHAYKTSSGAAYISSNGSDVLVSAFTLTVTPDTSLAGSCLNQRNLVESSDRFDQVGDRIVGCTSRYKLSIRPNWTSTTYVSTNTEGIAL